MTITLAVLVASYCALYSRLHTIQRRSNFSQTAEALQYPFLLHHHQHSCVACADMEGYSVPICISEIADNAIRASAGRISIESGRTAGAITTLRCSDDGVSNQHQAAEAERLSLHKGSRSWFCDRRHGFIRRHLPLSIILSVVAQQYLTLVSDTASCSVSLRSVA